MNLSRICASATLVLSLVVGANLAHGGLGCGIQEAIRRIVNNNDLRVAQLSPRLSASARKSIQARIASYFKNVIGKSAFFTHRGLAHYAESFRFKDDAFVDSFAKLKPKSHVIDLGAGELNFIRELGDSNFVGKLNLNPDLLHQLKAMVREKELRLSAVTLTKLPTEGGARSTKEWARNLKANENVNIHSGQYFETIPDARLTGDYGQASVVIDFFGVLTYTTNLPLSIEKTARLMEAGGDLWLIADSPTIFAGKRDFRLPDYLVETGLFEKVNWYLPEGESVLVRAHLRRTNKPAFKPNLYISHFEPQDGGPPSITWRND